MHGSTGNLALPLTQNGSCGGLEQKKETIMVTYFYCINRGHNIAL